MSEPISNLRWRLVRRWLQLAGLVAGLLVTVGTAAAGYLGAREQQLRRELEAKIATVEAVAAQRGADLAERIETLQKSVDHGNERLDRILLLLGKERR
jgi:hypothetical protein